ncbi:putative disease resistance protein RGA3 [Humulus lupulus]|uniref:putative disease resistance protein RGA3 n=1 Tax=Humulus lupulus TaxID=3486 RepID=UPI002B40AF3D|nr:putative disease resistance protein RGA3 [Humulus lupulus]
MEQPDHQDECGGTTDMLVKFIPSSSFNEFDEAVKPEKIFDETPISLKKVLRGKKFFFVLDDVWNENYNKWDFLKSTFESGARGSKIIVTTCNKVVAQVLTTGKVHKLQGISNEDCWKIFVDHAFEEDIGHAHSKLHEIGKEIVKKCKGLPLAVKSLGGLLC